ncbi:MAG UNVERIFIED_CONTAM: hypothetical protein LVT10_02000 [Anaerolineae bacterium]
MSSGIRCTSHLTWQTQPHVYANYSIFLAEIASNFNQALVRDHLLKTSTDPFLAVFNCWKRQWKTSTVTSSSCPPCRALSTMCINEWQAGKVRQRMTSTRS